MKHESVTLTDAERQQYSDISRSLAQPYDIHALSNAVAYKVPWSIVDRALETFWRY